ncbi:MAG: hypothetical protein ACLQB1_27925 [Streptosporangiaceae bacterium]
MPTGVFQPASITATHDSPDFNLWPNMMREYSEEFLGNPEHDGDGIPVHINFAGSTLASHRQRCAQLVAWKSAQARHYDVLRPRGRDAGMGEEPAGPGGSG